MFSTNGTRDKSVSGGRGGGSGSGMMSSHPNRKRQRQRTGNATMNVNNNKNNDPSSSSSSPPISSSSSSILSSRAFQMLLIALIATFLVSTELFLMLDWNHENEIDMLMRWHIKRSESSSAAANDSDSRNNPGEKNPPRTDTQSHRHVEQQHDQPPHLFPALPYWPPFPVIPNSDQLIRDTLGLERTTTTKTGDAGDVERVDTNNNRPTIAGIAAVLYKFLDELHDSNQRLSLLDKQSLTEDKVRMAYYQLAQQHLVTLDKALMGIIPPATTPSNSDGNNINAMEKRPPPQQRRRRRRLHFDIRSDDSIFISVAAYREHLLADTLKSIFDNAHDPTKVFVGVIVNNCFGSSSQVENSANGDLDTIVDDMTSPTRKQRRRDQQQQQQCTGGVYVSGHNKMGQDILDTLPDGTPDPNGIEEFCGTTKTSTSSGNDYKKFCENGQVRVLYVEEVEALGPTVARYYSSKLWGGETYYMQIDAHLKLAQDWDKLYIEELHATRTYPLAVLSTYPPGFINFHPTPPYTAGTRLCRCQLRANEGWLPRVEMQGRCPENSKDPPTQMPFMGAGFFFVHAQFLSDVPFDPFLPWMFMGEEVALSVRAWTHGYNIYAPRINLIGHQYRPIKMGNPHYQDTIAKLYPSRPALMNKLQNQVSKRIKYLLGYYSGDPTYKIPGIKSNNNDIPTEILTEIDGHHSADGDSDSGGIYSVGNVRTVQEYLKFAEIDLHEMACGPLKWCIDGTLT